MGLVYGSGCVGSSDVTIQQRPCICAFSKFIFHATVSTPTHFFMVQGHTTCMGGWSEATCAERHCYHKTPASQAIHMHAHRT